jgi:hypothetical protein
MLCPSSPFWAIAVKSVEKITLAPAAAALSLWYHTIAFAFLHLFSAMSARIITAVSFGFCVWFFLFHGLWCGRTD